MTYLRLLVVCCGALFLASCGETEQKDEAKQPEAPAKEEPAAK